MGLFLHLVSSDRPLLSVEASEIICTGLQPGPGPQVWVPSCILLYSFLYRACSMEFMSSKMSLKLLFVSSLQWLRISAQVLFHQPTAGEIINGGVPFIVASTDSFTAPYFSQMTCFSLLLLAGTYSSPVSSFKPHFRAVLTLPQVTLYAWNLSNTSPSAVSNSIIIPPSIGPSATSAYFLGLKGSILLNTSIAITYFSPKFTLHNMTGSNSLILDVPAATATTSTWVVGGTSIAVTQTASPGRMITCNSADNSVQEVGETGGYGPVLDEGCELEALGYFNMLVTQTRTVTANLAPTVTYPPAFAAFSDLLAPSAPTTSVSGTSTSTTVSGQTPTSTDTNTSTTAGVSSKTASNAQVGKMAEMLIITGITLAAAIILFFIWMKYGRRRYPHGGCEHHRCGCSGMKKMWDNMSRPLLYGKIERDAEKGGLVTVWRKGRESGETQGCPVSRGLRTELESSDESRRVSRRNRESEVAIEEPTRAVVRERGETLRWDRRSRRTILAELEGDTADADTMPVPTPDFEHQMLFPVSVPVPAPACPTRAVVVGRGEQGTVVRGREAAVIVAVGRRKRNDSGASATIQVSEDLLHIPPGETPDVREDHVRTKRQEQVVVLADATRMREMRAEIYEMRKSEDIADREGGESCASPFSPLSPFEDFSSIS